MSSQATKILVVDNYDSFVFNLVQYLGQLGAETTVVRNDEISVEAAIGYDGVLISPGPGTPESAGISIAMIKFCAEKKIPLFGVCLGHQAIGVAFGATVSRAPELMHGKTSEIIHNREGVFANLPSPFTATRYHSLAIERSTVPDELQITGETEGGIVMSVRHKSLPIEGVQFHPESVLTEHGHAMLANWLTECGDKNAQAKAVGLSPVIGTRG
jgi:para-aminobenzoate synthetase component II|uniref:aminodeoxychorismate/anthranilate synthase component II n=1 Tax=Candidatus Planktophila sp. TaxID=2175601 RepID=UPI00404AA398